MPNAKGLPMHDWMTTHEVAAYLRIKERKVYDLIQKQAIPCTRVTGKWLFSRTLINAWLLDGTQNPGSQQASLPVVTGSHDPLLEWAVRESGCELALFFDGSLDGLKRLEAHEARACGMHVINPADGNYNTHLVATNPGFADAVLIHWAWREQGLVVQTDNPLGIASLRDVAARQLRLITRQQAAGSHLLLKHMLAEQGIELASLQVIAGAARNERDAALAVADDQADAALAIATVAHQYRLGFVPLWRERYDLLLRRRDYFEPALQKLLNFTRTTTFRAKAQALGGYDVSKVGTIEWNA